MKYKFLFFLSKFYIIKEAFLLMWKDKFIRFSSVVIALLYFFSFFLFIFFPESLRFAGNNFLPVGNQPPGFEVTMLRVAENKIQPARSFLSRVVYGPAFDDIKIPITSWKYDGSDIVAREFSASGDSSYESRFNVADVVYPLDPEMEIIDRNGGVYFEKIDGTTAEESISNLKSIIDGQYVSQKKYLLGTDPMGRDVLSLFLIASRGTLLAAFVIALSALFSGIIFGLAAGVLTGKIRLVALWFMKSINSIPALLLIIALMFMGGRGFWQLCIVSGFVFSLQVANVIVSGISSGRKRKYVVSAYAIGVSQRQVMMKYILPDLFKPLFACTISILFSAILVESSLNFLAIGFEGNMPSWGGMIRENYGYIFLPGHSYLTLLPGIAISTIAVIFTAIAGRTHKVLHEDFNQTLI